MKRRAALLLLSMVWLVAVLVALEFGFRALNARGLVPGRLGEPQDRLLEFQEFVATGARGFFDPRPFVNYLLRGPGVNSRGFADREWPLERTPGVPRIACLGASTTQSGIRLERKDPYPTQLAAMLEEDLGHPVEVMNFGVDGWTSAESMTNYFLNVQDFEPDVVVVHFGVNDVRARLVDGFRSDYTHLTGLKTIQVGAVDGFLIRHSRLWAAVRIEDPEITRLAGAGDAEREALYRNELRPETAAPYRRNLRTIADAVAARGGTCVFMTMPMNPASDYPLIDKYRDGIPEHNRIMREVATETGALLVDVASDWERRGGRPHIFVDFCHVLPRGNFLKARAIADALLEHGIVE